MKSQKKTIAVVGAGIVGLSCALWLQKTGFEVILIDPEEPGSGTSSGNACTIADYGCVPVNDPSLFRRLPSLLFSADSPLSLDPRYALSNLPWMLAFLKNCKADKVARITRILAGLLAKTYDGLDPLLEMADARDLLEQQGCMYLYRNQQEFDAAWPSNLKRRKYGFDFSELDAADIRELEPNLKPGFERGLLFPSANRVLNPLSLCQRYYACLQKNGARHLRHSAVAVHHDLSSVQLRLDNGETLDADRIVIAAGAFSTRIEGIRANRLPLDTERGYHVQYTGMQHLLKRPVSWTSAGFYATPMDQGLRIAGTVEIAGYGKDMNQRNIEHLIRKSQQMLELPQRPEQTWLGFRPTFPDALPVIGYSSVSEYVLLAFGHQHIGLTLAGITGKLIAELANQQQPSHNITPFSPRRFL